MAEFISPPPRPVDHCVLPTADIETARNRLAALGFNVAPNGRHPFGTENCCVYLADGTFLEPLAVADEEAAWEAARTGNIFVKRDIAYRYRRGEDGFSALVFGTADAAADHAAFVEEGFSAGDMLEFSRDFVDASGKADMASFKLAFAADLRAPDCFFFTCERVNTPKVDRSALERHSNGVTRIKEIALSAPDAGAFAEIALLASDAPAGETIGGVTEIEASNSRLALLDNGVFEARFGAASSEDRGLQLRAIVFGTSDIGATSALLADGGVNYQKIGSRLIVQPAPGQGAIFAFEAE